MKDLKENEAITLISLVITIIILLILAGITISQLVGNGLFEKAKNAKEKSEYSSAYEKLNLKIMEANMNNIEKKGEMCNLRELEEYLGNDEETEINVINYNKVAYRENNIGNILQELRNIEVKVVEYKKYTFIIGETCKIEKYSIDGNEYIDIESSENKKQDNEISAKNTKLYYKDNDCRNITGGWDFYVSNQLKTSTLENNNFSDTYAEYNTTADNLDISVIPVAYGGTGTYIDFKTKNKIDLTSYDRIGILGTTENMTDGQLIGITDSSDYTWIPGIQNTNKVTIKNDEITYLDISDFMGEYYIQFGMGSYLNGKGQIKEIWLERDEKEILDVYNRGNEYTEIGGEWVNNPLSTENASAVLTKEENSEYMLFTVNTIAYSNPICSKTDLLDITGYDKLRAEIEVVSTVGNQWRNIGLGIYNKSYSLLRDKKACGPAFGFGDDLGINKIVSIDINDIIDEQVYFGVHANGYTSKIYRIWLEKIIK